MNCKEKRTRRGLHWEMECGHMSSYGFTPDDTNIAIKPLKEATNREEYIFIGLREILEKNESHCLDDETERLTVCQELSSWVKQNIKKINKI